MVPWLDQVTTLSGKRATRDDKKRIRELNVGMAVVFPNSFSSAYDVYGCGIPVRVGRKGRKRSLLLTHHLPQWRAPKAEQRARDHQLAQYLDFPSAMGWPGWDGAYEEIVVANAGEL